MTEQFFIFLAALLGLVVGSFLNVCIYRIPAGESIVAPPSRCASCGTRLGALDMVPLLSYMLLRGRCRHCGSRFSPRYLLVEALTAAVFAAVAIKLGPGAAVLKYLFLSSLLLVAAFIDLDHMIIPNRLVLAGLAAGAAFIPATGEITALNALGGAASASGFLLMLNIVTRGGMGMGDVKLAAVIGLFLGWPLTALALFAAFLLGGLGGVLLIMSGKKKRKDPIPFGPFLSAGAFVGFMWGRDLAGLYAGIISGF